MICRKEPLVGIYVCIEFILLFFLSAHFNFVTLHLEFTLVIAQICGNWSVLVEVNCMLCFICDFCTQMEVVYADSNKPCSLFLNMQQGSQLAAHGVFRCCHVSYLPLGAVFCWICLPVRVGSIVHSLDIILYSWPRVQLFWVFRKMLFGCCGAFIEETCSCGYVQEFSLLCPRLKPPRYTAEIVSLRLCNIWSTKLVKSLSLKAALEIDICLILP